MNQAVLRDQLVEFLMGGQAHLTLEQALKDLDPRFRNARAGGSDSVWAELEHMRLAQEDILRYTLDPNWKSPAFPAGTPPAPARRRQWAAPGGD